MDVIPAEILVEEEGWRVDLDVLVPPAVVGGLESEERRVVESSVCLDREKEDAIGPERENEMEVLSVEAETVVVAGRDVVDGVSKREYFSFNFELLFLLY